MINSIISYYLINIPVPFEYTHASYTTLRTLVSVNCHNMYHIM